MTARALRDLQRRHVNGEILDSRHVGYDAARRVWNAMADRRPALIVRAINVRDVAETVAWAAEHGLLLAVRGGGHSLPGLSTCDGGVVLDLSGLRAVTADPATLGAEACGGALLGDLDGATAPLGLVVPAGVVSHTGVAGLTLGGGMGWLSRRYGLTIDSLLAADIVTADGCCRHIDHASHPDLFWAIRGGGGNFGVVTRFYYRMHPLEHVLIGSWQYACADAHGVLRNYRELVSRSPRELGSAFTLTSAALDVTAVWSGDAAPAERAVAPFGELGRPMAGTLGQMTFIDLQRRSDQHVAWNRRNYSKGGYFAAIDGEVIERMIDCIATAPSPDAEIYVLQLGGAIADVEEAATAYTGRAANHYWIAQAVWDQERDDPQILQWARRTAARLTELSMQGNYVNEQSDFGNEVARRAYGETKYARLAELKRRHDPGNLFRLNQNIEPLRS